MRWDKDGVPYLIKAGCDSRRAQGRPYFLAIGRSLAAAEQTGRSTSRAPIFSCCRR